MKSTYLIIISLLILPISCSARDSDVPDAKTVQDAITHYFTAKSSVSHTHHPSFITGDFNGDGIMDLAALFEPTETVTTSKQVQISTPWLFPGSVQTSTYQTSLAIFNGSSSGWRSQEVRVFALLDKSGSLKTPAFQLTLKRKTDKDYERLQALLPAKHQGDLIVLPTEAGIDTYIFWDQTKYKLHVPAEIP